MACYNCVVWCGCGIVRCGLLRYATVWMVWYGVHCLLSYAAVWMVWYGVVWFQLLRYMDGMARCGLLRYAAAWMVWYRLTCYNDVVFN